MFDFIENASTMKLSQKSLSEDKKTKEAEFYALSRKYQIEGLNFDDFLNIHPNDVDQMVSNIKNFRDKSEIRQIYNTFEGVDPEIEVGASFDVVVLEINDKDTTYLVDFNVMFRWSHLSQDKTEYPEDCEFDIISEEQLYKQWSPHITFWNLNKAPEELCQKYYWRNKDDGHSDKKYMGPFYAKYNWYAYRLNSFFWISSNDLSRIIIIHD